MLFQLSSSGQAKFFGKTLQECAISKLNIEQTTKRVLIKNKTNPGKREGKIGAKKADSNLKSGMTELETKKTGPESDRFSGWTTLAGLMVVYAGLCGNITYGYGVFLPVMSQTFHWSRSALSGPYSLYFIVGGLLGPPAGIAVARLGARKIIIIFNLIAVLGLLGMSRVQALWQVYLFFGVLAGLGIAFGEFIPITSAINHWFIRKRSMAMGLLFASGGVGGFAMPPLISWLISGLGWRWTWVFLAGLHLLLTVIIGGILIRSRPEDLGQVPDGIPETSGSGQDNQASSNRKIFQTSKDWNVGEAFRTPALWMITLLFSITLFVSAMLTTHQVAYLEDLNFSPLMSATALGLMIGMSIIGRLSCGFLGMRFEGRYLAAVFFGFMGLGILALISVRGIISVYLYSVLTGIGFGGIIVLIPGLLSAYFGRKNYSRIIGWVSPLVTLISAGSPPLTGMLYDASGSYRAPFSIAAVLLFAGIGIAFLARPPHLAP
jgi:MFS family permease